jgi:hypothetical protein
MFGSITDTVDTSSIVSIPAGLRASNWFGYSPTGYSVVTQLIPGQSYWIKASGPGAFVLTGAPFLPPGKAVASLQAMPDGLNTLTITDNRGGSQTLYFGVDAKDDIPLALYAMPPAPPAGAFDARFETTDGGSMVQTHSPKVSGKVEFPVVIQSDAYPLTVSWKISIETASYELTDGVDGRAFSAKEMRGEGTVRIAGGSVSRIVVRMTGAGDVPMEFALLQNYPNPFNPSTEIKFSVEKTARATLELFNLLGQKVAVLFDDIAEPGQYHRVMLNAQGLSSGVYYCRLQSAGKTALRKFLLLK